MLATLIPHTFKLDVPVETQTTIFIDEGVYQVANQQGRKIALVIEPIAIQGTGVQEYLKKHYNRFELILTDYPELIGLPNAVLFTLALPWMQYDPIAPKDFTVSTVVGRKVQAEGHRLRHQLWGRQNEITIPKRFYRSNFGAPDSFPDNPILYQDKSPVFTSQFHICIENSFDSPDYFTEKILDCFRSKVVPIYWGAANIGSYFDARGIIQIGSIEDLISQTNALKESTYDAMLPFVETNYNKAERYINCGGRIAKAIVKTS